MFRYIKLKIKVMTVNNDNIKNIKNFLIVINWLNKVYGKIFENNYY